MKDKVFRHFGVGPGVAAALRALPDEAALLELCGRLDVALAEALLSVATDPDDLQGIVARYGDAQRGTQVPLREAVSATVNAERLWTVPPEQRALADALAGDATSWRVFLHPAQKRLVQRRTTGPVLVTGGPGTGKTVVALHRARFLAEALPASAECPVLVTTFSRVLAAQLDDAVSMLCGDAPDARAHIRVRTLVEVARDVVARAGQPHALLLPPDVDAAWDEVLRDDPLGKGRKFYESERDDVVLAQGIATEDAYLQARRTGRIERLDRAQKRQVWSVLLRFEAALARRGGDDAGGLARTACALLRQGAVQTPHSAVVCDEVQDASPHALRMLAALASPAGAAQPGPDRLFLVGDGHQRLYEKPASLRSCGIEVRGRSARLRLNYRTTQGICAAALRVLDGIEDDVLDAQDGSVVPVDAADNAAADDAGGYRSLRAGAPPDEHTFSSPDAEADFIADTIRATSSRPLLVLSRTQKALAALRDRLRTRGITTTMLSDADLLQAKDEVVLATLHRAKGLEAPHVILAARQDSPSRFPGGSDDDKALWERKERLLLYVGITRARDRCTITRVRTST